MSAFLKNKENGYDHGISGSLLELNESISDHYCIEENQYIEKLYSLAYAGEAEQADVKKVARRLIESVRSMHNSGFIAIEKLLQEYSLSDEDGVVLMCLAEALLRIPDKKTADALIQDKLSGSEWSQHLNKDNSLFVNASTWGLMIAGRLVDVGESTVSKLFNTSTKPVIRLAMEKAMRIMGQHFVLGRSIEEATKNAKASLKKGYDYSYDMLGESAITEADAGKYVDSYLNAIKKIAKFSSGKNQQPTLSIKLSALHPRFDELQRDRVLLELVETVRQIVVEGKKHNVGITIDAEEADRLELTLSLFEKIYRSDDIKDWGKFGLVVQAYSKRALPVLRWLAVLASEGQSIIPVRLVKGAYWDSEIQHSQVMGLDDYPVFTRKEYTDTSYLACARFLLSENTIGLIYPQFATHNAHTVASILCMVSSKQHFEFQRLHGMGDELYDTVLSLYNIPVRIYAPVGTHEDLLPYLVRRLLENGANSSFVHQLSDEKIEIDTLIQHPLDQHQIKKNTIQAKVPLPVDLFADRKNSQGVNLFISLYRKKFMQGLDGFADTQWIAMPIINGEKIKTSATRAVNSPYDHSLPVGLIHDADARLALKAIDAAAVEYTTWRLIDVNERASVLEKTADLMERHQLELVALCVREAGKTIQDSIDEIREAVDFCRYYAQEARRLFSSSIVLPGPTGETNELSMEGRGIFVCVSPWNFPLAIFMGQVAAAVSAGNTVIAKPAESTSLIAYRAVELFFEAGLPKGVLQYLPGSGVELGKVLNSDPRIAGVAFTGSGKTAHVINRTLAERESSIATLIAETGGLNAMIVDSTALPEQVAKDVITSAFGSAGQRCSALRILYVQEDIADRVITLIQGAMLQLKVGYPNRLDTDVGPIIDNMAYSKLSQYIESMKSSAINLFQLDLPDDCQKGTFVSPTMIELHSILDMDEEQFGPILHVARYKAKNLNQVISDINSKHYGLTLAIHTRNIDTYQSIARKAHVGNIYINRNQIGAVVGVNPFGGCGLSGTGPKAGGPNYVARFAIEKTMTINTTAVGGNVELLNVV
jgi:RHH-type proline utilization regulon transcriptional repressor/proline dehydrogenase/delta 1-pyrroline-5-carboxylate dehydrogenase